MTFLDDEVASHFPQNTDELKRKMEKMDKEWQFTYAFAAIDGCNISIKCSVGGPESAKEHHNLKHIYSIVMMAMVAAKYRIIWASAGFAGNAHDSIIFKPQIFMQSSLEVTSSLPLSKVKGMLTYHH